MRDNGAFPVPASRRTDDEHICGVFSQKLATHLAGLGWIGKSYLLVTPEHGPRVHGVTLLTDAPLLPASTPMEQKCGACPECVDICPRHAFNGRIFYKEEPGSAFRCCGLRPVSQGDGEEKERCGLRLVPVYLPTWEKIRIRDSSISTNTVFSD
jgi:ferredoxin